MLFLLFRLVRCNIVLMKCFLPLLILAGLLFGQDVLTHKSGKIYKGKYYGTVEQNIVFYVEGETGNKMFPIREVTSIETSDGELTYPFDVPITNERHETLNYSVTNFDILILKSGTTYFGEYSKIEEEIVYFKPQNVFAFQPISIKQTQTLKLKDGHFIIGEQLPVAIGDEFSVWLKSQEAIGTPTIEYMKLLGCTMVIILLIIFIQNIQNFSLGLDYGEGGGGINVGEPGDEYPPMP